MLKVGVGLAGYVNINVQGARGIREYLFNNAFVDTGLAAMSGAWDNNRGYTPSRLHLGSGRFEGGDHTATDLVQQRHQVNLSRVGTTTQVGSDTLVVTDKFTSDRTAKGTAWVLREFGSTWGGVGKLTTYAQLRDSQGTPTEIQLDETDVVTFTYYFQYIYPIRYEGTMQWESAGEVEEVPYTFSLGVGESPDLTDWTGGTLLSRVYGMALYAGEFGTGGAVNTSSGYPFRLSEAQANGTWRSLYTSTASPTGAMGFTFSRPLTKANTQTLDIIVEWELTNATPVPVPET